MGSLRGRSCAKTCSLTPWYHSFFVGFLVKLQRFRAVFAVLFEMVLAGRAFADFHGGQIDGRAALGNGYRRVAAGYAQAEQAADHFLGLGVSAIDQRRPGFRPAAAHASGQRPRSTSRLSSWCSNG